MRPGNIPPVEILTPLPVATSAGACFASDIRGTDRYIYYFVPTSTTAATFWRYDTYSNDWQQLAVPGTIGGNARFGAGCALVVDPSAGSGTGVIVGDVPNVWLFHPHAIAPFAQLQFYCISSNAWTTASQAGGAFDAAGLGGAQLTAQWAGDTAITHTCTALNSTVNDRYVYITGSNVANAGGVATVFYRYDLTTGTVAAMQVHAVAAGLGCTLAFIPQIPDRLYYQRGGATANWENYNIAANTWTNWGVTAPGTDTFTTGTALIGDASRGKFVTRASTTAGGQIKLLEMDPLITAAGRPELRPVGNGYLGDGTPHSGSLLAMANTGTSKYLYVARNTSTDFQRIWIVE